MLAQARGTTLLDVGGEPRDTLWVDTIGNIAAIMLFYLSPLRSNFTNPQQAVQQDRDCKLHFAKSSQR